MSIWAALSVILSIPSLSTANANISEPDISALYQLQTQRKKVTKPHVLFLLVDDMGWADIGAHDAGYPTTNIDSLLSTGIELTNYHVHFVCTPTRSALLSGQYSFRLGLQTVIRPQTLQHLPFDGVATMPELLKTAGYQTHMLGKWHLGYAAWNMTPTARGFDSHYGYFQGSEDYYTHEVGGAYDFFRDRNVERNASGDYSTMLYDDYVTQLLGNYHESRSKEPLFLYMAFQTIHAPNEPPPKNYSQCKNVEGAQRQIYCNKMQYLDDVILHYVDMFKQYGLWNDTLLVFSTDNGGMPYINPRAPPTRQAYGCNMPYRAGKGTLFQGGVKGVGFINGGDNVIPSKLRATNSNILSHVIDWLPTIVQGLAGQELPDDIPFDGISMWDALMDPEQAQKWERNTLFIHIRNNGSFGGLIDGDYKYIVGEQQYTGYFPCGSTQIPDYESTSEWLFDLKADPYEAINVVAEHGDLAKKYKAMIGEVVSGNRFQELQSAQTYPEGSPDLHDGVWSPWLG